MKTSEIREMSLADIKERIETERDQLMRLELNHSISPLENPMEIRKIRRNIARLITILNEKEKTDK